MIENPFEDDIPDATHESPVLSYIIGAGAGGFVGTAAGILLAGAGESLGVVNALARAGRLYWTEVGGLVGVALGVGYLLCASSTTQTSRSRA